MSPVNFGMTNFKDFADSESTTKFVSNHNINKKWTQNSKKNPVIKIKYTISTNWAIFFLNIHYF